MESLQNFYKYTFIVLVVTFLVIVAGSVVRTTQSGMGCPDWPKCFGTYIPPTTMEQVLFAPNKNYGKGQFIKYNDSLWYAKRQFASSSNFNYNDWTHYNKHGYTKIVIYQTWIEYINRLLGALLGLFVLIQVALSYMLVKNKRPFFWLSLLLLFLTGFQAWLGKTVVDSNLAVVKISIHLAGALAMVLLQLYIMHKIKPITYSLPRPANAMLTVLAIGMVIQFFMGVAVRQAVDVVAEDNSYRLRETWLATIGSVFFAHRSFSLVLIAFAAFIYFTYKKVLAHTNYKYILLILLLQLIIGILFIYVQFPAYAQPLHLILSCLLLAQLFLLMLRKKNI